jgi:hypothetical protein
MSSGQIVRKPLAVREQSTRTLGERLALGFPRLAHLFARRIGRLPPTSRLRQAIVWRSARLAVEAYNRRDLDAYLLGFHSDCEFRPPREFVEAGFAEPCYRGAAGLREYVEIWFEVFGANLRVEPVELIDMGDRLVSLSNLPARAQASGVPLSRQLAVVSTLKDGRSIRDQHHFDHERALQAVGLGD